MTNTFWVSRHNSDPKGKAIRRDEKSHARIALNATPRMGA